MEELLDSDEARRGFEEELLLVNVQQRLLELIDLKGIRRQDIADKLNVSESRISQMLSGKENLTLRSVAGLGWAMGFRIELEFSPIGEFDHLLEPGNGVTRATDMLERVELRRFDGSRDRPADRPQRDRKDHDALVPQRIHA